MNKVKFINMVTKAIDALEKQGVISRNTTDGGCCYRKDKLANSEIKCIVGHMFGNDFYTPSMEHFGAWGMSVKKAIYETLYTKKELEKQTHEFDDKQEAVILLLQRVHDGVGTFVAENFPQSITHMRDILEKYKSGELKYKFDEYNQVVLVD
jgi:hypothetical protein